MPSPDPTAIVTGADSGIGKAVALAYAREGADVLIAFLDEGDDARATVELIEAEGRRAVAVPGDLQDEAHCRRVVERARDELGRIDVLVNNAAFQERREQIEEISTAEWDKTLRTNLTATFWLCREAVPVDGARRLDHQRELDPGDAAVRQPARLRLDQGRARHLLESTVRDARAARHPGERGGSRPGLDAARGGDDRAREAEPVRRERRARAARAARHLAGALVFLASPAASFITGAVIPVTGGEFFG